MSKKPILWSTLIAAASLTAVSILATSLSPTPARAELNPVPPDCSCSKGTNLATQGSPVAIKHCQCGILSCAVVVSSGQLQCVR